MDLLTNARIVIWSTRLEQASTIILTENIRISTLYV